MKQILPSTAHRNNTLCKHSRIFRDVITILEPKTPFAKAHTGINFANLSCHKMQPHFANRPLTLHFHTHWAIGDISVPFLDSSAWSWPDSYSAFPQLQHRPEPVPLYQRVPCSLSVCTALRISIVLRDIYHFDTRPNFDIELIVDAAADVDCKLEALASAPALVCSFARWDGAAADMSFERLNC